MKLFTFIIVLLICISCEKEEVSHIYTYEVVSDANNISITLQTPETITQTVTCISKTWTYTWVQTNSAYLAISAKNNDFYGTYVTVRIYKDNYIIAQTTRYGPSNTASISGIF